VNNSNQAYQKFNVAQTSRHQQVKSFNAKNSCHPPKNSNNVAVNNFAQASNSVCVIEKNAQTTARVKKIHARRMQQICRASEKEEKTRTVEIPFVGAEGCARMVGKLGKERGQVLKTGEFKKKSLQL
jgi:glucuronate isomerase